MNDEEWAKGMGYSGHVRGDKKCVRCTTLQYQPDPSGYGQVCGIADFPEPCTHTEGCTGLVHAHHVSVGYDDVSTDYGCDECGWEDIQ